MFACIKQVGQRRLFWQCRRLSSISSVATIVDENLSHRFYPGKLPLVNMTVGQLFDKAVEQWPERECVVAIHQDIRMTYSEILRRADKLAAGLKKLGLQQGDRVGIWGPNDSEWLLAFIAIARAGCITVGINPAYQQMELDYCLSKVGVKAVIASGGFRTQNYGKMLLVAKKKCPELTHIVLWSRDHVT